LDLGGIGKGWTVDRVAKSFGSFQSYAVDAGGDLYAAGTQADGSPWTVGVEDPFRPGSDIMTLAVRERAVATSTVARRRWNLAGQVQHHLIDPRTGYPTDSGVASVTTVAGSVAQAEVLAKAALLLGPEAGGRFLGGFPGTEWVMVTTSGDVYQSPRLKEASHAA
jgi:thiamine biosynthesis lipoprotein